MLKIAIQSEAGVTKLKLDGRLAGPWVEELDRCWRTVAGRQQSQVVDLSEVTFIDPEGKALLTKMWQQGAKLEAVGCLTRCIVEEISKAGSSWSSRSSRKAKSKGRVMGSRVKCERKIIQWLTESVLTQSWGRPAISGRSSPNVS